MWTPQEIRKMLILLTGIVLEFAGVIVLWKETKTTGSIDISSSLISGKIETASAGLLLCFIGLFAMAISVLSGKQNIINSTISEYNKDSKHPSIGSITLEQKRGLLTILLLGIFGLLLFFGGMSLEANGWRGALLLSVLGFFSFFGVGILIIIFIISYLSDQTPKEDEPKG